MIVFLGAALAGNLGAVLVGSGSFWAPGCGAGEDCRVPERHLRFVDDDVWKADFLLSSTVGPRKVVLAEADSSTPTLAIDGPPTSAALLNAVTTLAAREDTDEILVYIASHGSPGEVHLADGRIRFSELRAAFTKLTGDKTLFLVADACHSASWRGGTLVRKFGSDRYPPVLVSDEGLVEAVVIGGTPEDAGIEGGVFSYLLFSALAGAADRDRDGGVDAPELSDFLHAYASVAVPRFSPRVHSPWEAMYRELPAIVGTPLTLDSPSPTRWMVRHPNGRWLMEAASFDGEPVTLRLPEGDYTVWSVGLDADEDGWASNDDVSVRPVSVQDDGLRWGEAQPSTHTADTGRSESRGLAVSGVHRIGAFQQRTRLARTWMSLGTGATGGWLPTDRWTTDATVGWVRIGPRPVQPWLTISSGAALVRQPRINMVRSAAGLQVRWLQRSVLQSSVRLGVGAEGFRLPRASMAAVGPFAQGSVRVDVRDLTWGVFIEVGSGWAVHRTAAQRWESDGHRTIAHAGFQWVL